MIWGNFLGKKMVKTETIAPLISYSSYAPEQRKLFVYIINKSEIFRHINISIDHFKVKSINQSWEYTGTSPDDVHPVWRKRKKSSLKRIQKLAGSSITVFELKLKPL